MNKSNIWKIAIMLTMLTMMLSGIAGVVSAASVPWWSDAFYIARSVDGFPNTGYVKGDTITLSLENEVDFQTIYVKNVAQIKNLDTGKIVKKYTVLPSKVPIAFGGTYQTTWIPKTAGRYQACTEVTNVKNAKKVRCAQTMIVYNKPTSALAVGTVAKSYKLGQQAWISLSNPGTLSSYIDNHYTVVDMDHGKSYVFSVTWGMPTNELNIGTGLGFGWDQKDNNGIQVKKGRYKIRWYWSASPSPTPHSKHSDSPVFTIN
jgi:hypothetical protein